MKTQNNKIYFNKESVIELNDDHLLEIEAGTSAPYAISLSIVVSVMLWNLR